MSAQRGLLWNQRINEIYEKANSSSVDVDSLELIRMTNSNPHSLLLLYSVLLVV